MLILGVSGETSLCAEIMCTNLRRMGMGTKMKKKHKFIIKAVSWILFIIYLIMMVYFLFFSEMLGRTPSDTYHYNLKPFTEIQRYMTNYKKLGSFYVILNLMGNVYVLCRWGLCYQFYLIKTEIFLKLHLYAFYVQSQSN